MKYNIVRGILFLLSIAVTSGISAAPSNDHFANRTTSSSESVSFEIEDFHTATLQGGEPGATADYSVWFQWTAPDDGIAIMDTTNSEFTCRFDVFYGTSLGNLVRIIAPETYQTAVNLPVTEGSVYIIRYSARDSYPYVNAGELGMFHINLQTNTEYNGAPLLRPSTVNNDLFTNRITIPGTQARVIAYNMMASRDGGEAAQSRDNTLWYQWTPPANGRLFPTVHVAGSHTHTVLGIWEGSADASVHELTHLDSLDSSQSSGSIDVRTDRSYFFSVGNIYNYNLYSFVHSFSIAFSEQPPAVTASTPRFAPQLVGKSTSSTVRISNSGGAQLTGLSARIIGGAARDFKVAGPRLRSLAPGATTTATVTFRPRKTGTRAASLQLRSNAATKTVQLTGRGR